MPRISISITVPAFASSGGAITSLGFSLGDAGNGTRYFSSVDLKTAGFTASSNTRYVSTAAYAVQATATISGQTMASLNAGLVEVYLRIKPVADLTAVK